MKIILNHNEGYQWYGKDDVFFKGYLINRSSNELYRGEDAVGLLQSMASIEELVDLLKLSEGVFAIVINKKKITTIAVDRARSIPLFYSKDGAVVSDSAEAIREELRIDQKDVDRDAYLALYAKTYLFGDKTTYSQIKQLDLGEIAQIVDKRINVIRYYQHFPQTVTQYSIDEARIALKDVSEKVFLRIKRIIGNRPVALSMSGGYDSRFVACMLKRVGIEDVSCYTYGKKDSFEVRQSKMNAEALGYRWTVVEYTDDLVKSILDEEGQQYISSFDMHDYTAYLQNFPAVRKLHKEGWFKPGTVFLTGLCGDMPSGAYVPEEDANVIYDNTYLVEYLYRVIYARQYLDNSFKEVWVEYMNNRLKELPTPVNNYQTFVTAFDYYYTSSCHPHCFLHMNRVHQFFGYEWLIPFWDSELLDFWYTVPASLRCHQSLYETFLLNDLCSEYGIGQKKTIVGHPKSGFKRKIAYFAGGCINWMCLHLNVPFRRRTDFNNWSPLELELYNHLKTKKTVVYHKAGLMALLTQYTLQERYGATNMIDAKKHFV